MLKKTRTVESVVDLHDATTPTDPTPRRPLGASLISLYRAGKDHP